MALDQQAGYPAQAEINRQRHTYRSAADDDDLIFH
jgi:hypothetical protein